MVTQDTLSNGRHTHFEDSDEEESQNVLTLAKASDLCPKPYRLVARNQNITKLADLSSLTALDYIDLSSNSLTSLDGLHHPRLKTLIVSGNNLSNLKPIYNSSTIRILNLAENRLPDVEWISQARFAPSLLTLVASSNQLHTIIGLSALSSLQTLVISNNQIEDLTPITYLKTIVKVSASRNRIRKLPSLAPLEKLTELRLSHNLIDTLPTGRLPSLKILDIGHNRLHDIDSLSTFAPSLVQVNLRHNPACEKKGFHTYVKDLCDGLQVIDGQRISGGRRKVRVNRIRKAVGFEIEHDRKFARMPSEYYLKRVKEKSLLEGNIKEDGERQRDTRDTAQRRQGEVISDEDDVEMDANKFVEMAKSRSQELQMARCETKVIVHASLRLSEERQGKNRKRKRTQEAEDAKYLRIDSFGDGGASRW